MMGVQWPDRHTYSTLSWLTGIAKSNLSAYRHGSKPMSATVAARIQTAGRTDPAGPIVAGHLLCYPQLALVLKRHMDTDPVHCTRLVRQSVQQLQLLDDERDIAAFHIKPPTTGDVRWNALVTGVAAHTWSLSNDGASLDWTRQLRPVDQWWQPGTMPARWRDWNLVHTPPSLRERRVIFPVQWLEAV
ncbi:MAG: hypothetical protein FWF02_08725 [Micrococcales bacterium]|nr:hypothetical protein [Micrococcales bacterium]MCL2667772.1 hypothetical protein [Micrococcales bacterium]